MPQPFNLSGARLPGPLALRTQPPAPGLPSASGAPAGFGPPLGPTFFTPASVPLCPPAMPHQPATLLPPFPLNCPAAGSYPQGGPAAPSSNLPTPGEETVVLRFLTDGKGRVSFLLLSGFIFSHLVLLACISYIVHGLDHWLKTGVHFGLCLFSVWNILKSCFDLANGSKTGSFPSEFVFWHRNQLWKLYRYSSLLSSN